jgi:hypothetical protein
VFTLAILTLCVEQISTPRFSSLSSSSSISPLTSGRADEEREICIQREEIDETCERMDSMRGGKRAKRRVSVSITERHD